MKLATNALLGVLWTTGLSGCTIFYEPSLLPSDGGMDGQLEGGPDGGLDGGPDAIATEIDCEDGVDNDGDKLVDCNDYDCSYLEACCQMQDGSDVVIEPWDMGTANWDVFGPAPEVSNNRVTLRAGTTTMIWKTCAVADLGLYGTFSFQPEVVPGSDCDAQFVSLGFTTAAAPSADARLPSEIEVRVNGCGRYQVLRGNTVTQSYAPSTPNGLVRFRVTPGTVANDAVMRATISIEEAGVETALAEGLPFISRDEMLDQEACGGLGRGLRLFVRGSRSDQRMGLDGIEFSSAQCANPSQFVRSDLGGSAQFDVSAINPGETWSAGGIGSPSLLPFVGTANWWLLYDATPDPRQIADFHAIEFGIGRASSTSAPGWEPRSAPIANAITPPQSCLDIDCREKVKYRDPFGFDGVIAYTREQSGTPAVVVETYDLSGALTLKSPLVSSADTQFAGLQAPACPDGVSQPTFARVPFTGAIAQYWLLFTCHIGDARTIAYQLIKQEEDAFVIEGSGGLLFGTAELAVPYAAGGIESPEIIVEKGQDPDAIYRLWFIARNRSQRRSVALAQWQPTQVTDPPDFVLFPGNPVLESSDAEANCGAGCKLESLAVARDVDQLRFLLAQSVNVFDAVNYRIVSLEQNWSRPQWP